MDVNAAYYQQLEVSSGGFLVYFFTLNHIFILNVRARSTDCNFILQIILLVSNYYSTLKIYFHIAIIYYYCSQNNENS